MKPMRLSLLLSVIFVVLLAAQDQNQLQKLREEIKGIEIDIQRNEARERSLLEQRQDLEREIGLRQKLLSSLSVEQRRTQARISQTETHLSKVTDSFNRRKKLIGHRMVALYKRGHMSDWEALLSLKSFNQFLVWMKYQKIVLENDQRNLKQLSSQQKDIATQREQLQTSLSQKEQLLRESRTETGKLERQKDQKGKMIVDVQKDIKTNQELLQQKQAAFEEIRKLINAAEERRKQAPKRTIKTDFVKMKGKLDWPVRGKITSKFGSSRDPVLRISRFIPGIEIKAAEGAVVRCVCPGQVITADWNRGHRNIVIVDHGEGHYTVYSYLEMSFVTMNEYLEGGTVIGRVGTKDDLNGSILSFCIWNGSENVDPVLWLKK